MENFSIIDLYRQYTKNLLRVALSVNIPFISREKLERLVGVIDSLSPDTILDFTSTLHINNTISDFLSYLSSLEMNPYVPRKQFNICYIALTLLSEIETSLSHENYISALEQLENGIPNFLTSKSPFRTSINQPDHILKDDVVQHNSSDVKATEIDTNPECLWNCNTPDIEYSDNDKKMGMKNANLVVSEAVKMSTHKNSKQAITTEEARTAIMKLPPFLLTTQATQNRDYMRSLACICYNLAITDSE